MEWLRIKRQKIKIDVDNRGWSCVMNPFQTWNLPEVEDTDFVCDPVVYNCDMYRKYSIDMMV
jgi:hypothetical protein